MDAAYLARAALRRAKMRGGVARSFDELERAGLEYWQDADGAARLEAIWELIVDAWVLKGEHGPSPRFDGSTCGVLEHER